MNRTARTFYDLCKDYDLIRTARDPLSPDADDTVLVCEVCNGVEGHEDDCPVGQVFADLARIARALKRFHTAELSISSAQAVLDLAVELNPELAPRPLQAAS